MDWNEHYERWKNSVIHLNITKAIYKIDRPYLSPNDININVTGFIIDIENGYVVTSSEAIENAIYVNGRMNRLGKRELKLSFKSICREKELGLCQLDQESIKMIKSSMDESIDMIFGDSLILFQTEEVLSIGYCDNYGISCDNGMITGFESNKSSIEDAKNRSPAYIQTNIMFNSGNLGGPLLNRKGEVIGIISNKNFVIPSRTFLSIYHEMINKSIVDIPTLALAWNSTNRELIELKTSNASLYGIYVRKIYPDSCSDKLEEGDIIQRIHYMDPFSYSNENFQISNACKFGEWYKNNSNMNKVICHFDRYGDFTLSIEGNDSMIIDRKISMNEIIDMIPIGSPLIFDICRDRELYQLETYHLSVESDRIQYIYPMVQSYEYEIFAGIIVTQLNSQLVEYFKLDINIYEPGIIIVKILSGTNAERTQCLKPGHIITEINGAKIKSLRSLRSILISNPSVIAIKTNDNSFFMVKMENFINEDKLAIKLFNIHEYNYLLNDTQKK